MTLSMNPLNLVNLLNPLNRLQIGERLDVRLIDVGDARNLADRERTAGSTPTPGTPRNRNAATLRYAE